METDPALITEGVRLAVVGMGTVFVFLTVLVWATTLMSRLILLCLPAPVGEQAVQSSDQPEQARLAAIIAAAVHAHRARQ